MQPGEVHVLREIFLVAEAGDLVNGQRQPGQQRSHGRVSPVQPLVPQLAGRRRPGKADQSLPEQALTPAAGLDTASGGYGTPGSGRRT